MKFCMCMYLVITRKRYVMFHFGGYSCQFLDSGPRLFLLYIHIMSFSDVLVKVMLCGWIGCGIHFSSVPLNTCVDFLPGQG